MGRNEELYITVPNLFRCPISLDVMKSPVSLCTGVTYDRSSIQHWLESGHDTCPATMQVLSSKDIIPNLTLHRLINLWNDHHSSTPPPATILSEKQVRIWTEEIKSGRFESLVKIVEFLRCSDAKKRFLADCDLFIGSLVYTLAKDTGGVDIVVIELIIRVLDLILLQNGVKEKLHRLLNHNCLSPFLLVIKNGNLTSKIESIRVLESISLSNYHHTQTLIPILLDLLETQNNSVNDAVLSFLISVTVTRSVKTQLAQLKLVETISKILSNQNATVSVIEKSMKLLSIVATCADGRLAISEDPMCAGCIVERLMKVSKTATEDGVMVLWSLCCLFKDERVKEKVVKSKGLTKVLLVMQSEGDGNSARKMCVELVKVLRVAVKDNGGVVMCYDTKTTHIMPC
ncbi:U-box domain-containing protein 29 [Ricinus communis]|uniref:U-box domain-containing protein n=1 Tax=Ricinus communis TaxID=3988 RepID=B9SJF8_RICCO|nr:U-box domain-containing protein 29 [Ricinus communis]EEF36203.1 ubiquitin-protein ligase, putative [Ricinus communis]|eukprot:XP_002526127.1 U-box domain-containing protein 29 [Ricinus communis]